MLRESMNRAWLEALERVDQIDVKLQELTALQVEKEALLHFCKVTSAMLEQYGLARNLFESPLHDGLKRVSQGDMPKQASELLAPDDDRLWKAIHIVVAMKRAPMTAGEVLAALKIQGIEVNGQHGREQVRTAMLRKTELFERVGRGLFALKEWSESIKALRAEDQDEEPEQNTRLELN